jgi:transcriptional regulator with XRE-family HTH domain
MEKTGGDKDLVLAGFADALQARRRELGLSIEDAAHTLRISAAYAYKLFRGAGFPGPTVMLRIHRDLGVSVDAVLSSASGGAGAGAGRAT